MCNKNYLKTAFIFIALMFWGGCSSLPKDPLQILYTPTAFPSSSNGKPKLLFKTTPSNYKDFFGVITLTQKAGISINFYTGEPIVSSYKSALLPHFNIIENENDFDFVANVDLTDFSAYYVWNPSQGVYAGLWDSEVRHSMTISDRNNNMIDSIRLRYKEQVRLGSMSLESVLTGIQSNLGTVISAFGRDIYSHMSTKIKAAKYKSPIKEEPVFSSTSKTAQIQNNTDKISYGNYHALIIGINNYTAVKPLKTAINDAKTVAALLKTNYGYNVKLLIDPTRTDIIGALSEFRKTLSQNDNLLIYYAGHGLLDKDADEGYWLPVDASRENEANWIPNNTLTSTIKAIQAKHVMVVSDSCYSGKLMRSVNLVPKVPDYMMRLSEKKARVVMTAGGLEPVVDSTGNDNHSVFASAFIKALQENTDVISGTELYTKIRRKVIVNSDQTPEYADIHKAGHDGGDFIFRVVQGK
ncbi:MAG: caspase family protein [Nitrospirae bacterium]|nr:caspase family protein [Nitrospirota bacterium]